MLFKIIAVGKLKDNAMQISVLFQRPAAVKILNVICGALVGYAIYANFYRIALVEMIFYKAIAEPASLPALHLLIAFILPSILGMFLLEKFYCRGHGKPAGAEYVRIMLPLLGFAVFLIMPVNFWRPVVFIFIAGIVVFRYAAACFAVPPANISNSKTKIVRNLRVYLIIVLLAMIAAGFYMQYVGLDVLYLLFYDWGVYLGVADSALKGNGFIVCKGETSFLGSHFSPASIFILMPYIWLFYSKYAIFLLNSLLLYSCAPMVYCFAKSKKNPEIQALLLAGCIIFSPSLANMNLSLFYGFHDIYFFMPLLILFFIFYEKGKYVPAFAVFGLTMLIKETIPVFWAGMGIAFVLYGRRKAGLLMILVSVIYWLAVIKLAIPWISGRNIYDYAGRFDYLGSSLWEIALSPLLKPGLFWGYLFRPQCILFGILLLLPLFLLCLSHPLLLIGGIISFVFICLQSSDQLQNICMQYQAEILTLIFINCVFALDKLNHSGERPPPLIKFLAASTGVNCKYGLANALLAGTVVTSLLTFYFFGQSAFAFGKNSFMPILESKSWGDEIAQIKALIPEKVPLNATINLAGHFILRNEIYPRLAPLQNYVLMDLNTIFANKKEMDRLRQKMLAEGYKVTFSKAAQGKHLVLFDKNAKQSLPDNIFTLKSEAEWDLSGNSVAIANQDFRLKVNIQGKVLKLYIRPAAPLKYDADIALTLGYNEEFLFFNNLFGNGITPAFNSSPGQVFVMTVKLPDSWDVYNKSRIEITPRPIID
jgi:uncharacterized membrane protein